VSAGKTLKAYLDLCRVSNLPTVWTNVLAATLLAAGDFRAVPFLLSATALSFFYLAGMALNDLCDREWDRAARPGRPIPSGRVSLPGARLFTGLLLGAGFLLLSFAPYPRAELAALLLCTVIVAYDRHHKKNPFSVLLMAGCRFLVFAVAALAVTGRFPGWAILGGGVQFCYIVVLSLIARGENSRATPFPFPFPFPVIPLLLAGISLLDGVLMALLVNPVWFLAGVAGFLLTLAGQRFVRGD
jgi:4-hydroxybenzoate polyprenyltransferase